MKQWELCKVTLTILGRGGWGGGGGWGWGEEHQKELGSLEEALDPSVSMTYMDSRLTNVT